MTPTDFLAQLQHHRILAVIRAPRFQTGLRMAQAAATGGLGLIEITWTSHHPADLVAELRHTLPRCCIGAGTLLSLADLEAAAAAGAEFGFSPYTDPAMLRWAIAHGFPLVPGALTPTEIAAAWQAGAPAVKVFPITAVGGPSYLRHLRAPLGHIPLVPTGGVTPDNAAPLLQAGATAVALSTGLFSPPWVDMENWLAITQTAQTLVDIAQRSGATFSAGQTADRA